MAELLNRLSKKNVELDYIRGILAAIRGKGRCLFTLAKG